MATKCSDNDILEAFLEHANYLNEEVGVKPTYTHYYQPTAEEMKDLTQSPLFNWYMY